MTTRRELLTAGVWGAAATAGFATAGAQDVVADTSAGRVGGLRAANGIAAFKGVPYGATTAGRGRFRQPRSPSPWPGVRPARDYGPRSPQLPRDAAAGLPETGPERMGEDCLVLNVWTPGLRDGAKRPVMVYFHGGGFNTGSGAEDGSRLARNGDVVVVTVNHRLNVFGFLYLGETAQPEFALSGSVGMLDCVRALEWVRENIEGFGGDPSRVTVFGISGGGAKVSVLCGMPAVKGLFHRAVVQSGSQLTGIPRDDAARNTHAILRALGMDLKQIDRLQEVPWPVLVREGYGKVMVVREPFNVHSYSPVVDGMALPRDPWLRGAPPESADVPMLIGGCRTETTRLEARRDGRYDPSLLNLSRAEVAQRLEAFLPKARIEPVIAGLQRLYPQASLSDIYFQITTTRRYRQQSWTQLDAKARQGRAGVYAYELYWPTKVDGGVWGTPHGLDRGLVFDDAEGGHYAEGGADVPALVRQMTSAWVSFARTGDPGNPRLPAWPAYTVQDRATMLFDVPPVARTAWRAGDRQVFASLPPLVMNR